MTPEEQLKEVAHECAMVHQGCAHYRAASMAFVPHLALQKSLRRIADITDNPSNPWDPRTDEELTMEARLATISLIARRGVTTVDILYLQPYNAFASAAEALKVIQLLLTMSENGLRMNEHAIIPYL